MHESVAFLLTDEERDILIELLDRERTNLPVEIHHTRTAKFKALLKRRLDLVSSLFDRLAVPRPAHQGE
jgi:hypothetical protein